MFKIKRASVSTNTTNKISNMAICTRLDGGPMYYMDKPSYWSYGEVQRMVGNTFVAYDDVLKEEVAIISMMREDGDAEWKVATFSIANGLDSIYDEASIYNLTKMLLRRAIEDKTCYTIECTIDYSITYSDTAGFRYLEYALSEFDFKLISEKRDLKKKFIRTIKPLNQDYYS